jgi:hypothetical protein
VIDRVRDYLKDKRGASSLTGLASAFNNVKSEGGVRHMDKVDFYQGLREFGVPL